jgi:hypothetical protein
MLPTGEPRRRSNANFRKRLGRPRVRAERRATCGHRLARYETPSANIGGQPDAGMNPAIICSEPPILTSPAVGSDRNSICCTPRRKSSNTAMPQSRNARPYIVGSTPCELRSKRRTPSVCSRSEIVLETTGCEMARRSAAREMLPAFATARNTRRSRIFTRRWIRSVHCMILAFAQMGTTLSQNSTTGYRGNDHSGNRYSAGWNEFRLRLGGHRRRHVREGPQ